jgi:uncharacterized protein YjbI with pentapeptide repeats
MSLMEASSRVGSLTQWLGGEFEKPPVVRYWHFIDESLEDSTLEGLTFEEVGFCNLQFLGGKWLHTQLNQAEFVACEFRYVYFRGMDFRQCAFRSVRFLGCVFEQCQWEPSSRESATLVNCREFRLETKAEVVQAALAPSPSPPKAGGAPSPTVLDRFARLERESL